MSQSALSDDELRAALRAVTEHGTITLAAQALRLPRQTFDSRYRRAVNAFGKPHPERSFEVEELPSELPTAEELLKRRETQFARKAASKDARKLVAVKVNIDGPYGLALFGDPHVDDQGTDIRLLQDHVAIVNKTPGMFAGNVGDYSNNWIGRLARLHGQQSVSAAEAWVLVEWLVKAVPWMFLIGGNHDAWSGDGDPIKWMARQARVSYEANGMRLGIESRGGRVIRLNARHDFRGRSQYNAAFGVAKAAQRGWKDHILVAGHIHVSGYQVVRDPASGLLSHCLRVGSYKRYDSYADEKGFPDESFTACPVVIVRPQFPDDDTRLITTFFEPETAASFLTWLRGRKSERAA